MEFRSEINQIGEVDKIVTRKGEFELWPFKNYPAT